MDVKYSQLSSQDRFRVLDVWGEELRKAGLTGQPAPSLDQVALCTVPSSPQAQE
jgi:hypothetical protein